MEPEVAILLEGVKVVVEHSVLASQIVRTPRGGAMRHGSRALVEPIVRAAGRGAAARRGTDRVRIVMPRRGSGHRFLSWRVFPAV
jgi:hypothetical protein